MIEKSIMEMVKNMLMNLICQILKKGQEAIFQMIISIIA